MYKTIEEVDKDLELHIKGSVDLPGRFYEVHLFPKNQEPKEDFMIQSVLKHCMSKYYSDEYLIEQANKYYEKN